MKSLHISLIAAMALSCTALSANTLQEALTGGKTTGEFAVTYELQDVENNLGTDSAYSVGSVAIKYESGVWNNFSFAAKARAYTTLYEADEGDVIKSGEFGSDNEGDAAQVFENIYLKYTTKNISVTAGRQFLATDWMEHVHDAVSFYGTWDGILGGTSVEAVNSLRRGKITAREYDDRIDSNYRDKNAGAYKLAVTQKFTDNIAATAYYLTYPDWHDKIGARVNINAGDFAFKAHYMSLVDETNGALSLSGDIQKDSNIMEITASYTIDGWTPYVGYVKNDQDGIGDRRGYATEEIINVMEEGDAFYYDNAEIIYVGLSKKFGQLSATLLWGTATWDDTTDVEQDYTETTLWLGYPITKALAFNTGLTVISGSDNKGYADSGAGILDTDQVNFTFVYSY